MSDEQYRFRRTAMMTHRFRREGDPEDSNVACIDCGSKPHHKTASQTCPGLAERHAE